MPLQFFLPSIQTAASSFAIQATAAPVHAKDEIEGVITAQARHTGGGLVVMPDTFNVTNRDLIIALANRYKVPAIYNVPFYAESGGLIAYGADRAESFRQAAGYIDRILKGATAADLPIQQPTKYELVVNLKTAKALGISVPKTLLATADRVIDKLAFQERIFAPAHGSFWHKTDILIAPGQCPLLGGGFNRSTQHPAL